jgi:hypothetical protein
MSKGITTYGIEDISPYLKGKIVNTRNNITEHIAGRIYVKSENKPKRVRLSQLQR